ncbi:MAG TPA: tetratricopeptide repeat protein [Terriglobales bacterium]|nr:tetratricopeptide repeat protein [Terriglobales bacterium]
MRRIFTFTAVFALLLLTATASLADSAREMLESGRVDDAISTLNGRLSSAPSDAESANLLCRAYFTLEEWDRAETACKRAIALAPGNGAYHRWLAHVYGEKADRASFLTAVGLARKTREEFERAVQLNPNDTDARVDLAEFYIEAPGIVGGGLDKARAQAREIGLRDPAREHWVYARIAEKNHDLATAEKEYHRMIEVSKGDSEAWLNLALFFRHNKRYDDMERALVATSQAPISKPDVLMDVAQNLYRTGRNFTLAIKVIKRYFALGPVEEAPAFKAHYLLGMLLEKQGDKAGAAREYQASLALTRQFELAQQALLRVGE